MLLTQSDILIGLTAVGTSAISSTLGMAGGLIMLSVLTMFMSVKEAIPIHGYSQFLSNIGRVVSHWKHINWKISWRFTSLVVPGAYLGVKCVNLLSQNWVQLFVAFAILWILHGPKPKVAWHKPNFFILLGFLSSFIGMIAGSTGPMIIPFFMGIGLSKKEMIATKAFCQAVIQFIKLPAFALVAGVSFQKYESMFILIGIATLVGTYLGNKVLDKLNEKAYEFLIRWSLTLIAFRMIFLTAKAILNL